MYNEDQKKAFISSYTQSEKTAAKIAQIFSWIEPYEEDWGKDLSQQSSKKLQPVINSVSGMRTKSADTVLIILKEYVKWCGRNGYEISRGIFEVRIDQIDKIQQQMVSSPLQLKYCLDAHFDDPSIETIDIVYRVFLWMAFSGLEDKDAVRVTSDCVDLARLKISFEGHLYNIYPEAIDDFEKACNLSEFLFIHPNYSRQRNRADGNIIMRGFLSPDVDLMDVRPILNRKFKVIKTKDHSAIPNELASKHLSYNRVYLSGVFYRVYEMERAGIPVDFSSFVADEMVRRQKDKPYTLNQTRTLVTIAGALEKEYLTDYKKWKCAFDM